MREEVKRCSGATKIFAVGRFLWKNGRRIVKFALQMLTFEAEKPLLSIAFLIFGLHWLGGLGADSLGTSSGFTSGPSPGNGQFLSRSISFSLCDFGTRSTFKFSRKCTPVFPAT